MSRFLKTLVALLATLAVAAPAFAITGDVSGFIAVRGVAADNMDGRDKKDGNYDDNTRAVDERLRLYTTAALNENLKAVFTIEVDYVWGDTDNDPTTASVGRVGADTKGEIEIANVYLDFNIPDANTNVKAGTHYMKLGGGLILAEHASGVSIRKAFSENLNLGLYWVKVVEGAANDDSQDIDYYHTALDIKAGGMTIAPFIGYLDADDDSWYSGKTEQYYYGVEVSGKADALSYGLVALYNNGHYSNNRNDAFAYKANAALSLGDTKLVFETARYGDSDSPNGEMITVAGYNNFSEILTGGYFDVRTTGGGVDTTVTRQAVGRVSTGNNSYYMNYIYGKVGVEQKLTDKDKVRAYYIYAEEAADNHNPGAVTASRGGQKRITFGHEIDAYYDRTIMTGLTMTVGGGYLLANDDYGYGEDATGDTIGGDNAWKAGLGLLYKF